MEKLLRFYYQLLWKFKVYRLKFNLAKLERSLGHKAEWVLSYELCHMILSTIPRDMLQDITRGFELNQEVELICNDLTHYQQSLVYVIDVIRATISFNNDHNMRNYDATTFGRFKYGVETRASTLGMLFVESETTKSTLELYDWLFEQLQRLMQMDRQKHLKDTDITYIERKSHVVLQDLFVLCMVIVQVAIERDPPLYVN